MNILFVVHRAPHPPDKGDRIRSFHLLKHLASLGRVHLAAFADEPVSPESRRALERLTVRLEIVPLDHRRWVRAAASLLAGRSASEGLFASRAMADTLRRWERETRFDAAIAFCSSVAPYVERLAAPAKFVDLVDVDSEKFLQYAERAPFPKGRLFALEGRRLRALERRIGTFADRVALATEPEAALYRSFAPEADAAAVPNGVNFDYFARTATTPEADSCVFVGAMDYRANVEGVVWFADHVWPEVRRRRPNAVFRIVGRRPAPAVQALANRPGIVVTGDVPDVRPYLARSMVSVAPLRVARGVQNKVLESLAVGRPVLASVEAAVGLQVADGGELLLAAKPTQWAERLLELWDDPALRGRLGDAGRRYVETHHSWESCLASWTEWLTGAAPARRDVEQRSVAARGAS